MARRGCLTCCLQTRDADHHTTDWHRRIEKCFEMVRLQRAIEGALRAPDTREELVESLAKLRDGLQGEGARLLNLADWPSFSPEELGERGFDGALVHKGARLWFKAFAEQVDRGALYPPLQCSEEERELLAEIKQCVQDLRRPVRSCLRLVGGVHWGRGSCSTRWHLASSNGAAGDPSKIQVGLRVVCHDV
jgi:hypothetical protein